MVALPAAIPETNPEEFMDAVAGADELQIPPGVVLESRTEDPAQTAESPVIGFTTGSILTL